MPELKSRFFTSLLFALLLLLSGAVATAQDNPDGLPPPRGRRGVRARDG